ncbi:MAG: endonuclease III [Candidatus Micrarchaeaceae archaeon]
MVANKAVELEKDKANMIAEMLENAYPGTKYYLNFSNPLELLVAAIISAQTRDETVNSITPELFKRFKEAKDYASASEENLVRYISKASFASMKAKHIIEACKDIERLYMGKVPSSMEELLKLPGVGRKTANTVLINAFGKVEGIPVDTWVIKLSYRMGLSLKKIPDEIEKDLKEKIDKKYWHNFAYVLKRHGKALCNTYPQCSKCIVSSICPKNGTEGIRR